MATNSLLTKIVSLHYDNCLALRGKLKYQVPSLYFFLILISIVNFFAFCIMRHAIANYISYTQITSRNCTPKVAFISSSSHLLNSRHYQAINSKVETKIHLLFIFQESGLPFGDTPYPPPPPGAPTLPPHHPAHVGPPPTPPPPPPPGSALTPTSMAPPLSSSGDLSGSGSVPPPLCAGCRLRIVDKYYLCAVDSKWHTSCLKCAECGVELENQVSCFERDGQMYCKEDYVR